MKKLAKIVIVCVICLCAYLGGCYGSRVDPNSKVFKRLKTENAKMEQEIVELKQQLNEEKLKQKPELERKIVELNESIVQVLLSKK